jgi:hypothetical protein
MNGRELLSTAGISLAVSTFVVLFNNYFLYRHCCPKSFAQPVAQSTVQLEQVEQAERSTK